VNHLVDFNGPDPDKIKGKIGLYGEDAVTEILEFFVSWNPANSHPCEKWS
jgi:hypothetical protein